MTVHACHLISCLLQGDGPSQGILAQVGAHDPAQVRSSLWSLYPPPVGRDPRADVVRHGASYRTFSMGPFLDLRVIPPLVRQLRRERPDILHCHLVRANLYGRVAARLAGVPAVISTLRNVEDYMVGTGQSDRIVRWVERWSSHWVSKYVAVSEGVRRTALSTLSLRPDQIVTILNAVDLTPFGEPQPDRQTARAGLGLRPDVVVIGSVGRLHAQKNYPFLLEVVRRLSASVDNWVCVIVGDGEERALLKSLVAEYGLDDRVLLLGYRTDVARLLAAFDVFVLPSRYEGLPRAVMEAMASGLPCVVSDVGGNAEAVIDGETGFVLPTGDHEAFVRALTQLVSGADLRAALGRAGRERAQRVFAPARMADDYLRLYSDLLGLTH